MPKKLVLRSPAYPSKLQRRRNSYVGPISGPSDDRWTQYYTTLLEFLRIIHEL